MTDRSSPQFFIRSTREGSASAIRAGVDVPAQITTFAFEDSEKAHKLAFELDNFDLAQFSNPTFVQGDLIEFSYGYDGDMSPPRQAVVTRSFGAHKNSKSKTVSLHASHGKSEGGIKLKIEAIGKEYLMNKVLKTRTFERMKRSDVAKQIAEENGYGQADQDIEDTQYTLNQINQSRMSDYQFLRDLANKEGFEVYIDSSGFHFKRRSLGQRPVKTLTYYTDGTGTIISFSLESNGTAKPGAVNAVGVDLLKGKKIEARGDNESTAGRSVLASVMEILAPPDPGDGTFESVFQPSGEITTLPFDPSPRRSTQTTVATTATNAQDAQRQADGMYQKIQTAAVIVKLHCVGDPLLQAKSVIIINGIGDMYSGRYYVAVAKHNISSSGYVTDLECRRDGTNGAGTGGAARGIPMSPQRVEELKQQQQLLAAEIANFQANVAADPDLKNDPEIQRQNLELTALRTSLEAQLANARMGTSQQTAGAVNDKPQKAPDELEPVEIRDPITDEVIRVEYRKP